FWPVNAVIAGILLRYPRQASLTGFTMIYVAMVGADLVCDSQWLPALWFNLCNLSVILTLWQLLVRLPRAHWRLRTPHGVLSLFGACGAGAAVAASLACVMAAPWFEQSMRVTWVAWFSEQFSTGILVLPAMLTAPSPSALLRGGSQPIRLAPLLVLLVSLSMSIALGGPGAIAFPIAALLWCALTYSPFLVSLLTLMTGSALIVAVAQHLVHFAIPQTEPGVSALMSARLGIAMLVLGPLVVACVSQANRGLMSRLSHRADNDHLTQVLSRSAFALRAGALLEARKGHPHPLPLAVLMLDIDHFKAINDRHGHAVGDQVLRQFAQTVGEQLQGGELFARFGGEEFVVLLPGQSPEQATFTAERLRRAVAEMSVVHFNQTVRITVSIGLGGCDADCPVASLDGLLAQADKALYRAKAHGRNRVALSELQRQPG
ncbi:MAG TPA: diguanylate cyclase, partial [Pseudomonas sp.]|uniref:GGDEF domain-containing protein n=1 Tax=Pseudomonas sp. TaxID=306 RepID=UPI002B47D8EA